MKTEHNSSEWAAFCLDLQQKFELRVMSEYFLGDWQSAGPGDTLHGYLSAPEDVYVAESLLPEGVKMIAHVSRELLNGLPEREFMIFTSTFTDEKLASLPPQVAYEMQALKTLVGRILIHNTCSDCGLDHTHCVP
jgi:hypothetical protein